MVSDGKQRENSTRLHASVRRRIFRRTDRSGRGASKKRGINFIQDNDCTRDRVFLRERGEFRRKKDIFDDRTSRSLHFRRNETAPVRPVPASIRKSATTQRNRISMASSRVPLKTSQCTFSKVNGRPFALEGPRFFLFFSSFQAPASVDTRKLLVAG